VERGIEALEQTYRNVKIVVVAGDITKQEVDAIVNPANSSMIMGGGVAGAIRRSGGKQIEDEAIRNAPVSIGEAVAIGAGRLKAGHVIHAPTMRRPAMRIETENVKLAVRGALECAERLAIQSIAFPGMGTGVGGLRLDEAATAMLEEIKTHIDLGTSLKEIVMVGFSANAAQTFERAVNTFMRIHE
jgi:O-acetyl-ADP-ribose deacetylase (regulator of RNase III)